MNNDIGVILANLRGELMAVINNNSQKYGLPPSLIEMAVNDLVADLRKQQIIMLSSTLAKADTTNADAADVANGGAERVEAS